MEGQPLLALFFGRLSLTRLLATVLLAVEVLFFGGTAFAADASNNALALPKSGIVVAGAVSQPGIFLAPLSMSEALVQAGGMTPHAYALGTVLLRPAAPAATTAACLARHQSWLSAQLATVPDLDPNIVAYLTDQVGMGRLARVPVEIEVHGKIDNTASSVLLGAGDVLIVPSRPSTVAVVGGALAGAQQWRYEPGFRVEDYLAQYLRPSTDQRALALYLPDGQLRELRLNFWNYERQVVPPGSVIWIGSGDRAERACVE